MPDIADAVVDMTETGSALRAAGPAGHRDAAGVAHRAHRQPGGGGRPGQAARHGADPDAAAGHARGAGQGAGQAQRRRREPRRASWPSCPPCARRRSRSSPAVAPSRSRPSWPSPTSTSSSRRCATRAPPTSWRSRCPRSSIDVAGPVPRRRTPSRAGRLLRPRPGPRHGRPTTTGRPTGSTPRPSPTAAAASTWGRGDLHGGPRATVAATRRGRSSRSPG